MKQKIDIHFIAEQNILQWHEDGMNHEQILEVVETMLEYLAKGCSTFHKEEPQ